MKFLLTLILTTVLFSCTKKVEVQTVADAGVEVESRSEVAPLPVLQSLPEKK